jgi:hypothetical protein
VVCWLASFSQRLPPLPEDDREHRGRTHRVSRLPRTRELRSNSVSGRKSGPRFLDSATMARLPISLPTRCLAMARVGMTASDSTTSRRVAFALDPTRLHALPSPFLLALLMLSRADHHTVAGRGRIGLRGSGARLPSTVIRMETEPYRYRCRPYGSGRRGRLSTTACHPTHSYSGASSSHGCSPTTE